jgi:hypothetical protein
MTVSLQRVIDFYFSGEYFTIVTGTARRRGGGLVEGVGAPLSSITMIQLLHC